MDGTQCFYLIWLAVEMCASFLRIVLIGCEDDLEVIMLVKVTSDSVSVLNF